MALSWKEIRERTHRRDERVQKQEESVTKDDYRRLKSEVQRLRQQQPQQQRTSVQQMAGRGARMIRRGFDDIAKSTQTAQTPRRPRISQMPKRGESPIARQYSLERLKMRGMRGQSIAPKETRRRS